MLVLHIIAGLNDGGAEAVLYRLCKNDVSHRHIVISLMDEGKYGTLLQEAGVLVHCLNLSRGRVNFPAIRALWVLLRYERPDAVQTWMYHADLLGGVVARLAGLRNVVWGIHHTILEPGKSKRGTILTARILAFLSWVVPRRIVVCATKSVSAHGKLGYDKSRMVVIPNGYDLEKFVPSFSDRARLRTKWSVTSDCVLLGMVGRFDPQKDHSNLLMALELLNSMGVNFHCVLVGTELDSDNAAIVRQIDQAGLNARVRLLGQRDDIPAVMTALDVHVLSSSAEAFPNVLAEAMACGTPCVTTDVGDAALIVGDTGWVVPAKNSLLLAEGLVQACMTLKNNPEEWQRRKKAARKRIVENFSIQEMCAIYANVWSG